MGNGRAACEGERYHDLCADPAACPCCSLWRRPDETEDAWKARIRAIFRAAPFFNHDENRGVA
jgi:hypothetical protein